MYQIISQMMQHPKFVQVSILATWQHWLAPPSRHFIVVWQVEWTHKTWDI